MFKKKTKKISKILKEIKKPPWLAQLCPAKSIVNAVIKNGEKIKNKEHIEETINT